MKAIMGFSFFLLFLAGIALVLLQGREMARQNLPGAASGITGKEWRPAMLGVNPVPADSGMQVLFAVDGSIKGHGGCNGFFGTLEKTADGVTVGPLGATRMACPEVIMNREDAFMQALQSTRQFALGEQRLQLLDADHRLLAELVSAN
ncbi:MAG: META domain-containing protein [Gammaproteobacteria bacterium]|nr:META domain-containing protein [Gammaproteobacteria bacterium]MDH5302476.1 META domain-containing protein [Gammaproteobacteria bacterium]MDH5321358.1 META domain-containing protein [Gammaproteobacteria bacterium]